jgi:hypothetical protein
LRSNSSIAILRLSETACVQMLMVVCSIRVPHLRLLILDRAHTVEVGRKGPPQRLERYCDQDVGACFSLLASAVALLLCRGTAGRTPG